MDKKRCIKAQITLFLIIGILMLFLVGFLFFVASQTSFEPRETGIEQSVSQLVAQCLKQRIIESYAITGINAERTKNYIDHELLSCADFTVFEKQAEITHGDVVSSVRVSDSVISVDIELPITIRQGDTVIRLNRFNYHLPRYFTTKLPIDGNGVLTKDVIARSADDRLELYIPAGTKALTNDEEPLEEITIHTRSITQRDPILYYYTVYDLQPHGAYFGGEKVRLSIKYVPSFNIENALHIVKREIGSNFWKKMPSTPNVERQMIETEIIGFSEVGLDPQCNSVVYLKTEMHTEEEDEEDGTCPTTYTLSIQEGSEDAVLCGIYLVEGSVTNRVVEQGFRLHHDGRQWALYDQELTTQELQNPEVLETISIAINNEERGTAVKPNENTFFMRIDSEGDCTDKTAHLTFAVTGENLNCGNVVGGECCEGEGCDGIIEPPPVEPPFEKPEPCGNKKGIVIHMRDVLLNLHYADLYIEEAKALVGEDGWVLEDTDLHTPLGNVIDFTQKVKDAGMRPIIRLSPIKNGKFLPEPFAQRAYDISQGLEPPGDYFVQVCNEPNHPGWECTMDASEYAEKMITFIDKLHELDEDERVKVVSAGLDPEALDAAGYAEKLFNYRVTREDGTEVVFHDAIDIWATHAYDTPQWQIEMDLVAKENIPVLITEAGYPYKDPKLDALCPGASVLKLMYNCLNPLAKDFSDMRDRAWHIDVPDEDDAPDVETGLECSDYSCHDPDCSVCYDDEDDIACCKDCKLWCLIKWGEIEDWRDAHEVFRDDMLNYYADWAENPIIIGVTPFLLFDDKEIIGYISDEGIDIKFDYECEMEENFRPRYWEYVTYRDNERACEEGMIPDPPRMPDPYQYYVFQEIAKNEYPTYDCPFLSSGPDLDDTGEALPEGENCITGNCLTLCLDATCSGWTATISNKVGCSKDFGDTFIDVTPPYDGDLSCSRNGGSCSRFNGQVLGNINPGVTITLSGSHSFTGSQSLQFCLHCHNIPGAWAEHDMFCVSTTVEC